jgi:hypothetical protein
LSKDHHHDIEEAEKGVSRVLDNGFIRFSSVVSFVVFVALSSWSVGSWFTKIESKLEQIENQLEISVDDRWRKTDMSRWCRETELTNPEWVCAELE